MALRRAKKFEEWLDLKPVTDEEFEELLNEPPRQEIRGNRKKKLKKLKKMEFQRDYF
ncbi:MAG: hypothetical protein H0Z28_03030 [Archaeoglobus sp.]|nr:hypothetical protein [Archaeoglobus sp.]